MNREYDPFNFEEHEFPLDAAIQAVLAEPLPEDAIQRVKANTRRIDAESAAPMTRTQVGPYLGRLSSGGVIAVLTFALGIAVAVLSMTVPIVYSGNQVFARVIERVNGFRSLRCTMVTRMGKHPEVDGKLFLAGNNVRIEQFDGALIQVNDIDQKQTLFLDTQRKLFQVSEITPEMVQEFANPIDQFRDAKPKDAVPIGEELLNGKRTQVYRLSKVDLFGMRGNAEMLVWVDLPTQLPGRIVIRDTDPKSLMEVRFEDFTWNEPIDAELFELKAPDGYQSGEIITTPRPNKSTKPDSKTPEFADGLLRDRVPSHLVMNPQGTKLTVIMRDAESVPPHEQKGVELRQWDLVSGKPTWSEPIAVADALASSRDGRFLATSIGYELQLRDAATGEVVKRWGTEEPLSELAFSPDGRFLAAGIAEWGRFGGRGGKESGGVQFWDVEQAHLVKSISDDKPVTFVKYSIDGKLLATSSNVGPIKLWDTGTGQLNHILPGYGHADFSPDGGTIVCVTPTSPGSKNVGTLGLFSLKTGALLKSFVSEPGTTASYLLGVTFSPNGRFVAAASWNSQVTLWDVQTGDVKRTFTDHQTGVLCVAFSLDGNRLVTGSEDKTVRVRNLPDELIGTAQQKN